MIKAMPRFVAVIILCKVIVMAGDEEFGGSLVL